MRHDCSKFMDPKSYWVVMLMWSLMKTLFMHLEIINKPDFMISTGVGALHQVYDVIKNGFIGDELFT